MAASPWWQDAVVYQVYPRSFQDSNGDGEGDLGGIAARLDHIAGLGADAVWLSPIHPSPMADGGYDVADYTGVDPRFGALEDLDRLVDACHARGLRLLLDLVPCHTSIEHPWFRDRPDLYVWSPVDGPPNNWHASFGGRAWSPDPDGRGWYLHSFYPEQPDLDWRHPEVRRRFAEVLRFWRERGVDGFRLDALDRLLKDPLLRDDPPAAGPPVLPLDAGQARYEHRHSRAQPDVGDALAALRAGAGDEAFLVGEVYLPAAGHGPYHHHVDVTFSFDLLHAPWRADALRAAIEAAPAGRTAWVLSNHDFARLPDRVGVQHARAAMMVLLTLPGPVFVFQGDETGARNGPGAHPPRDRAGRDPFRHPVAWDDGPHGGFTTGRPWLPVVVPPDGPVSRQATDPDSPLALFGDLVALRRGMESPLRLVEAADGVLAYRRGDHVVAVNTAAAARPAPAASRVLRATRHGIGSPSGAPPRHLGPGEGFVGVAAAL